MTVAHAAPAARPARPTGTMVAAGLAMTVPFAVTVLMMLTEAPFPNSVAGSHALVAAQHLVALLGAVVLFAVGRRVDSPVRRLGLTAVIAAVVLIGAQVSVQVADPDIGGGLLWFVAALVLAVLGAIAVVRSRRA
ncbi:hypothetical protein ACSBQY_02380 [Micrococcus lylae]|uniref:hypothetical protein n=1 Tax=Micrococcus lylae TaxID=1273 RepID=UPI003EB9544B